MPNRKLAHARSLNSPLAKSLARLHAISFATYSLELARLLAADDDLPAASDELEGQGFHVDDLPIDDAPEWVRDAVQRSREPGALRTPMRDVLAIIARDRLRQALARRGMKQTDLAAKLSMSPTSISRIFKAPDRSRLATLREIAAALDVDLSDILRAG